MKTTKRIFSILLTLCMLVSVIGLMPLTAFATESEVRITPSAEGGQYDSLSNTLVVVGGGEVFFTESGTEFDAVEGMLQNNNGIDVGATVVSVEKDGARWVINLPNVNAEYIFSGYYQIEVPGGVSTEAAICTVIVLTNAPLVYTNAEETVSVEFTATDGVTVPAGTVMNVEDYAVKNTDVVDAYKSVFANNSVLENSNKIIVGDDAIVRYRDPITIKTNSGDMQIKYAEIINIDGKSYVVKDIDISGTMYYLISLSEQYEYKGFSHEPKIVSNMKQTVEEINEIYQIDGTDYIAKYKFTTNGGTVTIALYDVTGSPAGMLLGNDVFLNSEYENKTETVNYENGVINVGNGNYVLMTDAGVKKVSTVWSKDVYFTDAQNNPLVLSGNLHFSGDNSTAVGAVVHIGANGVDVGTKTDGGWDIAMNDQSPVIAFSISDFEIPSKTVSLTVGLVDEPQAPDGLSTGAIVAIVIACVVVLAGGGFALYWFVFKKKKVITP